MTVRAHDLFQQILCGGTLNDKLLGANLSFTDLEWSGDAFALSQIPELPGREFALKSSAMNNSGFPKKTKLILENEEGLRERGRLLHYFANHELLAIETMALTLLRFPTAPIEFKRGVFKTLQDEQRHMSLYLARMKEYGVSLGDAPFSFYFWNRLRDMKEPLDFVVRMSMTFEQANLDFALEYAQMFEREIGDEKTAALLKVVHDDEVKHVGHGVKWFHEWNQDSIREKGEWNAYLKELPYPLNARRAKGSVFFSEESRRQAGFSKDYIDSIRIAGGSRGRVPDYYLFNPECEIEGEFDALPRTLNEKIEDLAPLMLWLAQSDDVVELPVRPSGEFLKSIFPYRGELPEIVTTEEVKNGLTPQYEVIESIKPWGWGRRAWAHEKDWFSQIRQHPSFTADLVQEKLFSKVYWKQFLLAQKCSEGEIIESLAVFNEWLLKQATSKQEFIFKHDHSTSGRGHVVFKPSIVDAEVKKLLQDKTLKGVIEPYYLKEADFSVQYEIQKIDGQLKVKAFEPRLFFVDDHLQYQGAWLGSIPVDHELYRVWKVIEQNRKSIQEVHEKILQELIKDGYQGPVGIDAMVAKRSDHGDDFFVVPVIEVNVRYTMGRVAQAIEGVLRKRGINHSAKLVFHSKTDLKRTGASSFIELMKLFPAGSFFAVTPAETAKGNWVIVQFQ